MASPLSIFRKYQYLLLVGFGVMLMFAFVIAPPLAEYLRNQAGRAQGANPVVVKWKYGTVNESELAAMRTRHLQMTRFLRSLTGRVELQESVPVDLEGQEVHLIKGRSYPLAGVGTDKENKPTYQIGVAGHIVNIPQSAAREIRPKVAMIPQATNERELIQKMLLAKKAEQLGIVINDAIVMDYLDQLCDTKPSHRPDYAALLEKANNGRLSMRQLVDQLTMELAAQRVLMFSQSGIYAMPPEDLYESFNKLNRRVTGQLLPLEVAQFVQEVTAPAEEDVRALYEVGKDRFPNPDSPEPGFKLRKRIAFGYFRGELEHFLVGELDQIRPTITDEEIDKYYEQRKDTEFKIPELPAAEPASMPAGEPAKQPGSAAPGKADTKDKTSAGKPAKPTPPPADSVKPPASGTSLPANRSAAAKKPTATTKPPKSAGGAKKESAPGDTPKTRPSAEQTKAPPKNDPASGTPTSKPAKPVKPARPAKSDQSHRSTVPVTFVSLTMDQDTPPESKPDTKGSGPTKTVATGPKVDASKIPETKAPEKKTLDKKTPDTKTADRKIPVNKAANKKTPDTKTSEKRAAATKTADTKAPEKKKTADTKPSQPAKPEATKEPKSSKPMKPAQPEATQSAVPDKAADAEKAEPGKQPKYKPLDDVLRKEIRERLAREKATPLAEEKMNKAFSNARHQVDLYARKVVKSQVLKNVPPPEPFDLDAVAKANGLTAGKTPLLDIVDVVEIQQREATDNDPSYYPFLTATETTFDQRAGMVKRTVADLGFRGELALFTPRRLVDGLVSQSFQIPVQTLYSYWRMEEEPERVPELDEIHDMVVMAWKLRKALPMARERAQQFVDKAKGQKDKPLIELYPDQAKQIIQTSQFSWMTRGSTPMGGSGRPMLSSVSGVQNAKTITLQRVGSPFMQAVFALSVGEMGIAVDNPQTTVYVVQVSGENLDDAKRRELFLNAALSRDVMTLVQAEQGRLIRQWYNGLEQTFEVNWMRAPTGNWQ